MTSKLFGSLILFGIALLASADRASAASILTFIETPEHVEVKYGDKVVARFMTAHDTSTPERVTDTYKPYLHVFSLEGGTRLTKGPGGSFPHHRGIFVGYNKISAGGKMYDRWHMKGGDQIVRKVRTSESGNTAMLTADIEWEAQPGTPLLTEERKHTFTTGSTPFYFNVELESTIKPVAGEATLDGDPEHAGAQFRPSEKIEDKKTVYLFPGDEVDAHKALDLPWAAEIFTVEGKTFTVAILNHPDNPKGTRFSAYRNYGRFGAFPVLKATPDAPAKLRYKWVVAEGEVRDPAAFQAEWNKFAGKNEATPTLTTKPADQPAPKKADTKKPAEPKPEVKK